MKIKTIVLSLLMGFFCLSSAVPTHAQEAAMGEIASMLGTVEIQRAKQTAWLKAPQTYGDIFWGYDPNR